MRDSPTDDLPNAGRAFGAAAPASGAVCPQAVPPGNARSAIAAKPRTLADSIAAEVDDLLIF